MEEDEEEQQRMHRLAHTRTAHIHKAEQRQTLHAYVYSSTYDIARRLEVSMERKQKQNQREREFRECQTLNIVAA